MLTIAICEDDRCQQNELERLIKDTGLEDSVDIEKFSSGEELVQAYEDGGRFSIILLDMQMNELSGIQTAEIIRKWDKVCLIIIITSIMEYAVEGYSIDAYDFILKPVDEKKFTRVFSKAIREIQTIANKVYTIQTRDLTLALRLSEIAYIESSRKHVIVHAEGETYINNENISSAESKLKNDGFIRISRYFLVNVNHIKVIGVKTLTLTSGEQLNYGEKFRDSIKRYYMNFMMGDI